MQVNIFIRFTKQKYLQSSRYIFFYQLFINTSYSVLSMSSFCNRAPKMLWFTNFIICDLNIWSKVTELKRLLKHQSASRCMWKRHKTWPFIKLEVLLNVHNVLILHNFIHNIGSYNYHLTGLQSIWMVTKHHDSIGEGL